MSLLSTLACTSHTLQTVDEHRLSRNSKLLSALPSYLVSYIVTTNNILTFDASGRGVYLLTRVAVCIYIEWQSVSISSGSLYLYIEWQSVSISSGSLYLYIEVVCIYIEWQSVSILTVCIYIEWQSVSILTVCIYIE
jgi:hypothetical protein